MKQEYSTFVNLAHVDLKMVDLGEVYELLIRDLEPDTQPSVSCKIGYKDHRRVELEGSEQLDNPELLTNAEDVDLGVRFRNEVGTRTYASVMINESSSRFYVMTSSETRFHGIVVLVTNYFEKLAENYSATSEEIGGNGEEAPVIQNEYRRIVQLNSVTLYLSDLVRLVGVLRKSMTNPSIEISVKGDNSDSRTFKSVSSLQIASLPARIKDISIRAVEDGYKNGVTVRLSSITSEVQVYSEDEVWFLGKIHQVKAFFRQRRRIYTPTPIQGVMYAAIFLTLCIAVGKGIYKEFVYCVSFLLFSIFLGLFLFLTWRRSLVLGTEKPTRKINYESMGFLVAVLTLLATVVATVIALKQKQ